jgi:(p)ppGpp synthase/HD superfamily hydrolase
VSDQLSCGVEYLVQLGADRTRHSDCTLLDHLAGLHRDLTAWQCSEDVCMAGLFHSIYGTQSFHHKSISLERRDEVRRVIGARAERLVYLYRAVDRRAFDASLEKNGPVEVPDVETGQTVTLEQTEFDDLCRLQLCDHLEQMARCQTWDSRRSAFQRMAMRLGGPAKAAYEHAFADEAHCRSSIGRLARLFRKLRFRLRCLIKQPQRV